MLVDAGRLYEDSCSGLRSTWAVAAFVRAGLYPTWTVTEMDREMTRAHLVLAERHVAEGAERVRRQRELHRELVRKGHVLMARDAAAILSELRQIQAGFVADRDRLAGKLADR